MKFETSEKIDKWVEKHRENACPMRRQENNLSMSFYPLVL